MVFLEHLTESVIPAIISGGGTAVSTIFAFARDLKRRLDELEKRVGSIESKTGLVYSMQLIEEALKGLQADLKNLPSRGRFPSYSGADSLSTEEEGLFKVRDLDRRLKDLEEDLPRLETKLRKYVSEEEFEQADHDRAQEIAAVRTTLAEVRGLLQGLQSALGLISKR